MKILLIYPYFLEPRIHAEEIAVVPMGLYYVGAMLKAHGYEVEILNWYDAGHSPETLKEALICKKPDLIGVSIVHANRWGGIDIARISKALDPNVPVVFGGIGATFLWEHLLTHFAEIDYVVLGEGEFTFLALVQALERGAPTRAVAAISGLVWRAAQGIVNNGAAEPIKDLDTLPPPARYFDFQHLSLTRGCPGRCTFCGSPRFWGRRVRSHSADYFVDQLAALVARGATFFFISDDTFTLNAKLVIAVCRKIIQRGLKISWQAIAKVNAVNAKMLYWMRKAGCVQISFGVESGSPQIRRLLCKDISHTQIQRAFALTTAHGLLARAYFIYGVPGESHHTIEQTLALIAEIKPLGAIFYMLTLFPGTALYETFKAHTGLDDDIWLERREDILSFEHDPDLDQERVLGFGRQLRSTYHQWLPEFARQIVLNDDPGLKLEQADFLSRLGLTFSHGDYARLKMVPAPVEVARELFERALERHPDHRAFWGLALIHQRQGDLSTSLAILESALVHFPQSETLHICKGVALMNQGAYDQALASLLPFSGDKEALALIVRCRHALGHQDETAR
jgi:anaerobic magnesium-protoporphyrin IX monomethyl ester cyclase